MTERTLSEHVAHLFLVRERMGSNLGQKHDILYNFYRDWSSEIGPQPQKAQMFLESSQQTHSK